MSALFEHRHVNQPFLALIFGFRTEVFCFGAKRLDIFMRFLFEDTLQVFQAVFSLLLLRNSCSYFESRGLLESQRQS